MNELTPILNMIVSGAIGEDILKSVIDTAPFPMGVYTGHEMKIVLANKCMVKTYGKGPDVVGKNYTDILPELENQKIFEQLRHVLTTGEHFEAKNQRVDIVVDGILKPHYFNYNFTPVFDAQGSVFGVMNTAADVTELNTSRQNTLEAEKKLRLAINSANLGIFEIDRITGDVKGSVHFFSLFRHKGELFDVDQILVNVADSDVVRWNDALDELGKTGKLSCEVRLKQGEQVRWVRFTGSTSANETESHLITGIVQDITDEQMRTEELTRLIEARTAELTRSNDDLRQFGHVISHDLKEPIRKVSVFTGLLQQALDRRDEALQQKYSEKIKICAERLAAMVDSILRYSEPYREEVFETVALTPLLHDVFQDLELRIQEKGATFNIGDLPSVSGSRIQLYQLFYNLINNALKFSKENVAPYIKIGADNIDGHHQIFVQDNGIGIPTEFAEKIFGAFQRLHSKDRYEGTGLGLALCRKIAEKHGGSIKAVEISDGAKFVVSLPK